MARLEVEKKLISRLRELSSELAKHFREDEISFSLDNCLILFASFCLKVEQAMKVSVLFQNTLCAKFLDFQGSIFISG